MRTLVDLLLVNLLLAAGCVAIAVLGQPLLALLAGGVALLVNGVGTVSALLTRRWPVLQLRGLRALLWLLVAGVGMVSADLQDRGARERAATLIAACERFHDDFGRYPGSLDALVPAYLDAVPAAIDLPLQERRFAYLRVEQGFQLGYAAPSLHWVAFDSASGRWWASL